MKKKHIPGRTAATAAIPLAGPWVVIGTAANDETVAIPSGEKAALVMSGIFQALGVGAFIAGLVIKRDVKKDSAIQPESRISRPSFHLVPTLTRHSSGLSFMITM